MTEISIRSAVLVRALHILQERGWSRMWSTNDESPLNIRSAVAKSCTEIIGQGNAKAWHDAYLDAVHAIGHYLKNGITNWESGVKTGSEVEAMLTEVINRLETDDIPTRQSRPRPSGL